MDRETIIKRLFKYFIMALAIFLAARYVPQSQLTIKDSVIIAIIGTVVFAVLDMFVPM